MGTPFIGGVQLEDTPVGVYFVLNRPEPGKYPTWSQADYPIFTILPPGSTRITVKDREEDPLSSSIDPSIQPSLPEFAPGIFWSAVFPCRSLAAPFLQLSSHVVGQNGSTPDTIPNVPLVPG